MKSVATAGRKQHSQRQVGKCRQEARIRKTVCGNQTRRISSRNCRSQDVARDAVVCSPAQLTNAEVSLCHPSPDGGDSSSGRAERLFNKNATSGFTRADCM